MNARASYRGSSNTEVDDVNISPVTGVRLVRSIPDS
jgi:hypothetical protein